MTVKCHQDIRTSICKAWGEAQSLYLHDQPLLVDLDDYHGVSYMEAILHSMALFARLEFSTHADHRQATGRGTDL